MVEIRDKCIATFRGLSVEGYDASLDLFGADDVEIRLSYDGRTVWINTPGCVLRICNVRGVVRVEDDRPRCAKPKKPTEEEAARSLKLAIGRLGAEVPERSEPAFELARGPDHWVIKDHDIENPRYRGQRVCDLRPAGEVSGTRGPLLC